MVPSESLQRGGSTSCLHVTRLTIKHASLDTLSVEGCILLIRSIDVVQVDFYKLCLMNQLIFLVVDASLWMARVCQNIGIAREYIGPVRRTSATGRKLNSTPFYGYALRIYSRKQKICIQLGNIVHFRFTHRFSFTYKYIFLLSLICMNLLLLVRLLITNSDFVTWRLQGIF